MDTVRFSSLQSSDLIIAFCMKRVFSPVQNAKDSVKVYFELYIAQLIKIDEVSQVKHGFLR